MIEALSINKKIEVVVEEGNKEQPLEVERIETIEIDTTTITRAIAIIIAIVKDQEIVMTTTDAVRIQEIRVEIEIEIGSMRVVEIEIIITITAIVIIREIINKILEIMIDVQEIIAQATISHIRKIMIIIIITSDQVVVDIKGVIIHMIEIINQ